MIFKKNKEKRRNTGLPMDDLVKKLEEYKNKLREERKAKKKKSKKKKGE